MKYYNKLFYKGQQLYFNDFKNSYNNFDSKLLDDQLYAMIYFFFKLQYPKEITLRQIFNKSKKNLLEYNDLLQINIKKIINYIYDTYPNIFIDYVTPIDIQQILKLKISIPKMNFLFYLIKYYNPRKYNKSKVLKKIGISHKLLSKWASTNTYVKYLKYFEAINIIKRNSKFLPQSLSKSKKNFCKQIIFINWKEESHFKFIHSENQYCPITLAETIKILYPNWITLKNLLITYQYNIKQLYKIKHYVY